MKKTHGIVILIMLCIGVLVIGLHNGSNNVSEKVLVKIGATLPLTGDIAMLGESNRKALELALANLKDTKYSYRLVIEDDGFKSARGAATTNKLISIDKVIALISFGSPVGNVVSPLAEKAGVPHINDFASDPNVAQGNYNFVHYTPASEDSKAFITELQKRGIKKIALFGQKDNPGVLAIITAFEKDITATDINVVSAQYFNTGTRDFKTLVDKVKGSGAELLILEASTPELEILTKQVRAAGIKVPVASVEAFEFSDQLELFEGMWYVNAADPMDWFVNQYTQTYGAGPKIGAANGYDAFNLLVRAIEESGNGKIIPSGRVIAEKLAQTRGFDGALGNRLTMGSDHIVMSKAVIREIRGGKPVTVK